MNLILKPCPYLRNLFLSPTCVMATRVFVTDVPMLVPIIIGTAVATSSTVEEFKFIKSGIYYIKICSDNDSI